MASAPRSPGPMPLKRAGMPSPRRRWRSIAVIRRMAASSAGSGVLARAAKQRRSGSRSSSSSTSTHGLRLMWPPSGGTWRSSSATSSFCDCASRPIVTGDAQIGVHEADQGDQARDSRRARRARRWRDT